ncbi:MAG: (2Fe-2S) ferredoxin domain-containing protein [Thermoanaerobaculia bacterium]
MESRSDGTFPYDLHVLVCIGKRCSEDGVGEAIRADLKGHNKELGNKGRIRVCAVSCLDLCDVGPNVVIWPAGETHGGQSIASARRLYEAAVATKGPLR